MPVVLKPCPFCGAPPILERMGGVGSPYRTIECSNCDCDIGFYPLEDLAVSVWNTRQNWIKTTERKPVTGALCWIVWADVVQSTAYRRVGVGFDCCEGYVWEAAHGEGDSIPDLEVTHWQPMPDAPINEKETSNGNTSNG